VINKIDFVAKNLTSNAGIFLLFENAKTNGIFELINTDLVFDNESTNKIMMNHIKTMLCSHIVGIDKLERLKLLQSDPLINEFDISVKEPETVSRFLGNFSYKTTQMFREINFKVFKKLLCKSKQHQSPSILTAVLSTQNVIKKVQLRDIIQKSLAPFVTTSSLLSVMN
jgi:hypothetical protein